MKNFRTFLFCLVVISYAPFMSSCNGDEGPTPTPTLLPETLDCNYFREGINRTLTDDPDKPVDYLIECGVSVDVDLVIEPGVVIEFTQNADMVINGSISAKGTSEKPIIFTGVDKVSGSWRGIRVNSDDVKNELDHVQVKYAGGSDFSGEQGSIVLWGSSGIKITNCLISDGESYGLNAPLSNTDIKSFENNTLTNNETPLYVRATYAHKLTASNDFSGNLNNYVHIGCSPLDEGNWTWEHINVAFQIIPTSYGITRTVEIPSNTTLTIEAGTTVNFETDTGIKIGDGAGFKTAGTASDKVTLTGVDGAAGAWKGLEFRHTQSLQNVIENTLIEFAGSGDKDAAIYMWADPKLIVANTDFKDIDGCVFTDGGSGQVFDNPNLTESGNTYTNTGNQYCID